MKPGVLGPADPPGVAGVGVLGGSTFTEEEEAAAGGGGGSSSRWVVVVSAFLFTPWNGGRDDVSIRLRNAQKRVGNGGLRGL